MAQQTYGGTYKATAADNYQRYFVPAIGGPVALDLIEAARLQPGDRVLDVACGTGVVTRLAAEQVGPGGTVAGLDINPGMLATARSVTPAEAGIDWYESPAEAIPVEAGSFDVVLCQMGLQFFSDRQAGLKEMRRVLAPGGRVVFNLPGPIPAVFEVFEDGLARHVNPQAAEFASLVFSLHDPDEIRDLARGAGFGDVTISSGIKTLRVPPPNEFLWQYVDSTPLAEALDQVDQEKRAALEDEVCARWQQSFVDDGNLIIEVNMTTAVATG